MAETPRIAIVTDSTADLPEDLLTRLGITVVPLNVHIGGESFRDQIDLTTDEFMGRLADTRDLPSTSQPSAGIFERTFREIGQDHDAIVCVLISSRLSGTVQSAQVAADAVGDVARVEVIDSLSASLGCGFQVLHAHRLADQGLGAKEIATRLRSQTMNYHVVFFVETLDHLRRGGRIGKAASLVGSMLKLKPLLRIDEGQVVPFERTRTRKRAIEALVEFAQNMPEIERIGVLHNTTPEDAERLSERVQSLARRESEVPIAKFGPVLGTHVGPGTLGLAIEVANNA
ncbi:MAG TPA: DegV family protein [Thermomicrobiales bacterium]|nr:DegV family protein [Thermomicrobiales bacterium]